MKRIVICSDGTWNRPEQDEGDVPTNVLKMARAIAPADPAGVEQVVFYDWGIGSYHDQTVGGATGRGINKNIQDGYRFLVQNYDPGDELFFFGFSRGAYTVRSLAGFMNNCSILRREHAHRVAQAFALYKDPDVHPNDQRSVRFRRRYGLGDTVRIRFIGVWDTVGALGVPLSFAGFLNDEHVFHDTKIGPNIDYARHALAIDEEREDFEPTLWTGRRGLDLEQVWFAGVHSDVGGGYIPTGKRSLSDQPLRWIASEAELRGLRLEPHLVANTRPHALAKLHDSRTGIMRITSKKARVLYARRTRIHSSVKTRWDADPDYRPKGLVTRIRRNGWTDLVD